MQYKKICHVVIQQIQRVLPVDVPIPVIEQDVLEEVVVHVIVGTVANCLVPAVGFQQLSEYRFKTF